MEKRLILAMVMSIIVLVVWSYFSQPRLVHQKRGPTTQKITKPRARLKIPGATSQPLPFIKDKKGGDVVIETDLYRVIFSTKGAIIKSWELKKYKGKNNTPVWLLKNPGSIPPLAILFETSNRNLPQKLLYKVNTKRLILDSNKNSKGEVIFTSHYEGISIKKRFVFYNDDYRVDFSIETLNTPPYLLPVGTNFGIFNKKQMGHRGPVILMESDKRKEFNEKLRGEKYFTGDIRWIAQEDKYFTAAIVPLTKIEGASIWKENDDMPEIALKLNSQRHEFILYAGPKEYDRLKRLNVGLEHIIYFGRFSIVAMPLFWVLKFFYKFLGNYGWAIVLLTLIIRIPFIPLMHKSQQSMKKMQAIQPLMNQIREKYKKDPQKMQKEIMELYKKHKVNPLGGCLPLLLQIPIFIALYNVLLKAIELRGAPFILWIKDLSARDPYYILPVVMGVTMVIQQKMTPTTMDPRQAKFMMLMPIIFTFLFLTFPAGLVLYWLVNNIIAIAQQYYINKKT